jgi:hypothetical protein
MTTYNIYKIDLTRFNEAESEWTKDKTMLQNKLKIEEEEKEDILKR